MPTFGDINPSLTRAVNAVARRDTAAVKFRRHALVEMGNDNFDQEDVLACLRKGKAHGPEDRGGELRANVVHRGLYIRVVIGGLGPQDARWRHLQTVTVVTVMRFE
jgi:hypothetical protein